MITEANVNRVIFGVLGGAVILLILCELLSGRFWRGFRTVRRQDEPFSYWMNVLLHSVLLGVLIWFLLLKPVV